MLESLIFIILSFIGIVGLIISLIILLIGFLKRSKKLKRIGLGMGTIPIFCIGIIAFWYIIAIPSHNSNELNDFAGTYSPHKSAEKLLRKNELNEERNYLILKENGTYIFDSIPGIDLRKSGKWETGGIDGQFIFYDNNGNQIDLGSPSGSGMDCGISFRFRGDKDDFFGTESIYFKKVDLK